MNETLATTRLRRAVRAVILADDDRVLLCRFSFPHPGVPTGATIVWAAPAAASSPVNCRWRHCAGSFKVTNLNMGGAISGATASISGPATASTTTDANGNYSFAGLQPGTYSVTGTHSGYKARTYTNVTVTAGQTTTQNIQLTTTGRVAGTVTSSGSGTPVAGATITLQGGDLPTTDTVTSNSSGSYTSSWDPIGTYTLTCSAPGFSTDTIPNVQITTGGLSTVNCQI